MATESMFQWPDYLVFGVMLAISSVIGLYFGIMSRKKHTASADEMLTGNRKLPVIPVAMSLGASFTSATTILGIPAEVYARGGEQWIWVLGLIPCFLIAAFFIVPIFYNLHLTNAYEYLELRFNYFIRCLGSFLFSVIILVYMAAVLYAPAVAFSQVTGLSREISILAMGAICTFYTSIGGIRAVVWTDAFQLIVVWVGLMTVMFKGAEDAGGWTRVWEVSKEGSRLPKFDMNPDPFVRHTFWTLFIGGGLNMLTVYGANQANLQRYASVRTLSGARLALLLNLPMWIFYLTILCLMGLVMYVYFLTCDPLKNQKIKPDQLVPLFVLRTMGDFPGLPGLFLAAIFSASISTVSSGINSLAAVSFEDLFKPCFSCILNEKPSKRASTLATIIMSIIFGCVTIALTYGADFIGNTAVQISFGIFGMVGGPLLGLIMSGIFFPFINCWGAATGLLASLVASLYVGIDPVIHPGPKFSLPLRTDGCHLVNSSHWNISTSANTSSFQNHISTRSDRLYLSYIHYATWALLVSLTVGIIVSAITCCNRGKHIDERTYYHYEWLCSKKSTSYDLNHGGGEKPDNEEIKEDLSEVHDLHSKNGLFHTGPPDSPPFSTTFKTTENL
ncbi:hypothetical protein Btru_011200 [Bulinus truncatus]|nr:hypothetical protein Btru_011200 [Bulinus truncatus]